MDNVEKLLRAQRDEAVAEADRLRKADQRPDPCQDRAEWLRRRERLRKVTGWAPLGTSSAHWATARDGLTEAALGCPCPPEPPPIHRAERWSVLPWGPSVEGGRAITVICDGVINADDAEAMADALREHARWLREHGGER